MASQATGTRVNGHIRNNMYLSPDNPKLAEIANSLRVANDKLRESHEELKIKYRRLREIATEALKPMDIPHMNKQELALYELLKTL